MASFNISKIKRSLRLSMYDGAVSSASAGLTQNFIIPFALQLQASTFQIGLLTSVPNILMAFSQLVAPNLTEKIGSRKGIIVPAVILDAFMWLPILMIPYLFKHQSVPFLLMFITFKTIGGSIAGPAWGSMMADLTGEGIRGRYFSRRNMINNACSIVTGFAAMIIMQHFENINQQFSGFSIIFGGALVLRMLAAYYLSAMYEPPMQVRQKYSDSILKTIAYLKKSNLGKFTMVMSLTMFTMNIAGPFSSVYLLRDLKFDYIHYVIITGTGAIFSVFLQPFWGRRADKFGNIMIIKIVTVLMPLVPIAYIFSANIYYLIGIQVVSAFNMTGLNLAMSNYIFDASTPEERTRHLAVFTMFAGLATCGGALFGGLIASHLPSLLGFQLKSLFLIAGLTRLAVVTVGFRQLKEVRQVPKIGILDYLFGKFPKSERGKKEAGFNVMPDFEDDELIDSARDKKE
jgi:MFS family permease